MKNSLLLKLQSSDNFGSNGMIDCNLTVKKLDYIQNTQTISDCGCDMVFVPTINRGTLTTSDFTDIPSNVLEAIMEWSVECTQNLVIVFQAEAESWGYSVDNANVNPNTPVVNDFSNSVFNGPFGSINSIVQGGAYQGVLTSLPDTGTKILAEDANGNTTIGLDLATNDIIVGDIGIFCSGSAGDVSEGSQIITANDIFVCNIIALGCQLTMDAEQAYQLIEKCSTETVMLPNGMVTSDFGNYMDTIQGVAGCDSIINITEVIEKIIDQKYQLIEKCSTETVMLSNGLITSDFGNYIDTIQSVAGCDSIVNITEVVEKIIADQEEYQLIEKCSTEAVMLPNGLITSDFGNYMDTIQGVAGCDSIINITEVIEKRIEPFNMNHFGCTGDGFSVTVNGNLYDELNPSGQELLLTNEGCDSIVNIDFLFSPLDPTVSIDSIVTRTDCTVSPFNNLIPNEHTVTWSSPQNLSCSDCPNPLILAGTESTYTLTLFNKNNCQWSFDINIASAAEIFIPNIFSPNRDGYNDRFSVGISPAYENNNAFEIKIFDRWGGQVFTSTDLYFEWDGTFENLQLPIGIYTYWLKFNCNNYDGDITLIR